jgi:7,8-dihydropterin-6-yl-methyl-4-(beta-D-ribofuranosyl)aminobenzene 5'-phosphate synthase
MEMHLAAVDRCEVLVLVDNVNDLLSSLPANVTGEIANVVKAGATQLAGHCLCCAQWGLSLVVCTTLNGIKHSVLFDSGPEGYGVKRNGARLGLKFDDIDAAVFSHGHWDHVGGMTTALELITGSNGGRRIPVHVNEGMFVRRAVPKPGGDGSLLPFENVPSPEELSKAGGEVICGDHARTLLDGHYYVSGEIPRRTSYEKGMPGQVAQAADGSWYPDPLIRDERWMAVNVKGLGAIVFTACSHAGVVNVLLHAQEALAPIPLWGVMGGFHLGGPACEPLIPQTVADLKQFDLQSIVPGHCTGWRAVHKLVDTFGDKIVVPSAVGRRHIFAR